MPELEQIVITPTPDSVRTAFEKVNLTIARVNELEAGGGGGGGGGGAVDSVNGQDGDVTITAAGLGAPTTTEMTAAIAAEAAARTSAIGVETAARTAAVSAEVATRAAADTAETAARIAADALLAPLASPPLTGNPTAPTQSPGNNSTRLATTAFVAAAVAGGVGATVTDEAMQDLAGWDDDGEAAIVFNDDGEVEFREFGAEAGATAADVTAGESASPGDPVLDIPVLVSTLVDMGIAAIVAGALVDADVGVTVQGYDADLAAIAALTSAANKLLRPTGAGTWGLIDFPANSQSLVSAANYAAMRALLDLEPDVDYQVYDADTLKSDTSATLTVGYGVTPFGAGTKSSGTFTPTLADGNYQTATNNGAHTLAVPTGNGAIAIHYTNGASAGTITTSGWTIVKGDSLTNTNAHKFILYLEFFSGLSSVLTVKALQ